jgi:hypothetical protein
MTRDASSFPTGGAGHAASVDLEAGAGTMAFFRSEIGEGSSTR